MASATTLATRPASFPPASNSAFATRSTDRHCSMTWKRLGKTTGWSDTRRRRRQRSPRPQPCPWSSADGTSLGARVKARKCGHSRFQDWERGVGGGVAKRPFLVYRALTSPRSAANAPPRLWSSDSPALVFATGQKLSGRRSAASWRCSATVRMKVVMRKAFATGPA